jgi:hypothetical protein
MRSVVCVKLLGFGEMREIWEDLGTAAYCRD